MHLRKREHERECMHLRNVVGGFCRDLVHMNGSWYDLAFGTSRTAKSLRHSVFDVKKLPLAEAAVPGRDEEPNTVVVTSATIVAVL
jgi:hypothetical protein